MSLIYISIGVTVCYILRIQIIGIYTRNPASVEAIESVIIIYLAWIVIDTQADILSHFLLSLCLEEFVFKASSISLYIVGVFSQLILGFALKYRFQGIWLGLLVGSLSNCLAQFYKFYTLDWQKTVQNVCNGVRENSPQAVSISNFLDEDETSGLIDAKQA